MTQWRGAFRRRNFRLFFAGQLVSLVGTWMQSLAQAWLVLDLTGDPFWLGIVGAAQFAPVLVVGLFGGVIADVLPKRATLIATQAAQMTLALALALLTFLGLVEAWQIVALSILLGFVNSVDMPTRQAFVMEMVGREDLTNAVGLNSATFNGSRIVGPAIAGVVIGAFGVTACFALNGVSFLAVIAGLLLMRDTELLAVDRPARPTSAREVVDQLAEGLRYVRTTPVVLLAVVLVGVVSTAAMNFNVVVPALGRTVLRVDASGLGFLMAALGLGSLTSSLAFALLPSRRPRTRALVVGALAVGLASVCLGLAGLSGSYAASLVGAYLLGAASIGMLVIANSTIQLSVPDRLRGRVLAVYTTVFTGTSPFGALVTGWIASTWGTGRALVVAGIVALGVGVLAGGWVRRGGLRRRAPVPAVVGVPVSPGGPPRGSGGG